MYAQDGPQEAVVKARVVIGADGNQSAVRQAIIGVRGAAVPDSALTCLPWCSVTHICT
jgi:2-polyprenyl-6-methoxyphenol hydroxylase-like FAD-dependent oxidoreductase